MFFSSTLVRRRREKSRELHARDFDPRRDNRFAKYDSR